MGLQGRGGVWGYSKCFYKEYKSKKKNSLGGAAGRGVRVSEFFYTESKSQNLRKKTKKKTTFFFVFGGGGGGGGGLE